MLIYSLAIEWPLDCEDNTLLIRLLELDKFIKD